MIDQLRGDRADTDADEAPPIWLLDVDGVINASKAGWSARPRRADLFDGRQSRRIWWSPALIERIGALHRGGRAEVRWCTTWCPWADLLERALRLPTLTRAFADEIPSGPAGDERKLAAARQVLADGRRLVWTDDTAIPASGPERDALTEAGRSLLIAPSPRRGLRPEHMASIEVFATRHA